ncbi:MAG: hypothetical protein U0R51_06065 [Solirubrobacterales bacterium]
MKKLSILVLTAFAALSFAAAAEAKTQANVRTFGDSELETSGIRVAYGEVFSSRSECYSERGFRFAVQTQEGKQVIDAGRTSVDGAISGGYDSAFVNGRDLYFVLGKTKHCAGETVKVNPPVEILPRALGKPPVKTFVIPLGLNGNKKDGVFAGLIGLKKRAKCFDDRKTKLLIDGKLVDRGTTSFGGSWALHLTIKEFDGAEKMTVKVAKSKLANGTTCGGASYTYIPAK